MADPTLDALIARLAESDLGQSTTGCANAHQGWTCGGPDLTVWCRACCARALTRHVAALTAAPPTTDLQKAIAWAEENPRTAERIDLAAHLATATWSEQCYLAVEDHTVDLHQHIAHLIAAGDAVIASLRAAAARCGTCAHSETVSPSVSHLWCHVHDQARAPNDGCRLGYAPKETP